MNRLQHILSHLSTGCDAAAPLQATPTASVMSSTAKADDDVVICCAVRTAIGKAGKGGFKDTPCEDLLAPLFKAVVEQTKVNPKKIGDCQVGNVLQPTAGAATSRMAMFLGNLPYDIPCAAVNRQCSSGLQAVANIAASIKSGIISVGLAGGVESMSMYKMTGGLDPNKLSKDIGNNDLAA